MPQYCRGIDCPGGPNGKRKRANYNLEGLKPRYCKTCKTEAMTNTSGGKTCAFKDKFGVQCITQPTFNIPGQKPKFCDLHKDIKTMINTLNRKCQECKTDNAYYNFKSENIALFCKTCKKDGMVSKKQKLCFKCGKNASYCNLDKTIWSCGKDADDDFICPYEPFCESGCGIRASFNILGEKKPRFCYTHKEPNMTDVTHAKCKNVNGCLKSALFGFNGQKAKYCGVHKDPKMINLYAKKCKDPDCELIPSFNWSSETTPIYCDEHKDEGMINVSAKLCKKCTTTASFNYPGFISPIYCVTHIEPGMVCVTKKSCRFPSCKTRPSFNFDSEITPLFCDQHKDPEMINIRKDSCLLCYTSASFNYPGETRMYCRTHSLDGMIDVTNKMCPHEDCTGNMRAIYNFPGQSKAIYCRNHKEINMVDIVHKMCQDSSCSKTNPRSALYGYPGQGSEYCSEHMKEGMIILPNTKCSHTNCTDFAIFGSKTSRGEFCEEHAPQNYLCVINKTCSKCNLLDILDQDGYCVSCNPENFINYRLAKQKKVIAWLNANGHDDYTSVDTIPDEINECKEGNTFGYRPDVYYDCGTHFVIIEVDEEQHNTEKYRSCDLPRMINIQQSLALPTIFIRYNPDSFKINGNKTTVSDNKRLKTLIDWLQDAKIKTDTSPLEVVYLFYDDYQENEAKYKEIDILSIVKPKPKFTFKKRNKLKLSFKKRNCLNPIKK